MFLFGSDLLLRVAIYGMIYLEFTVHTRHQLLNPHA